MIVTLSQFKAYLRLDTTAESPATDEGDSFYTDLLTRAQKEIENELDTPIEQATVTAEYHDCSQIVVPAMRPYDSSLTVKYVNDYSNALLDTTLTKYTDYFTYPTHIVFTRYLYTGELGRQRIKLAYTGGYASASVPTPLVDAVIKKAAYMLRLNDPIPPDTSIDRRIPADLASVLAPYKRFQTP